MRALLLSLSMLLCTFARAETLEVAVFVDPSMYQDMGTDCHQWVIDAFALIEDVYDGEGIELDVTTVLIAEDFTRPLDYDGTGAEFLFSFREYMEGNWSFIYDYDVGICLHTQAISRAGLAYLNGACNADPDFRYAYARQLPNNLELSAKLLGHELGHLVGADHDLTLGPNGERYLMWGTISSSTLFEFSPQSQTQIQSYLAGITCLDDAGAPPKWWFRRGDPNNDGFIDISDPTICLDYAFNGILPFCIQACDTNDDGLVLASDAIYLLNFMFMGGPPPAFPHPAYGPDFTFDGLTCGGL